MLVGCDHYLIEEGLQRKLGDEVLLPCICKKIRIKASTLRHWC